MYIIALVAHTAKQAISLGVIENSVVMFMLEVDFYRLTRIRRGDSSSGGCWFDLLYRGRV